MFTFTLMGIKIIAMKMWDYQKSGSAESNKNGRCPLVNKDAGNSPYSGSLVEITSRFTLAMEGSHEEVVFAFSIFPENPKFS